MAFEVFLAAPRRRGCAPARAWTVLLSAGLHLAMVALLGRTDRQDPGDVRPPPAVRTSATPRGSLTVPVRIAGLAYVAADAPALRPSPSVARPGPAGERRWSPPLPAVATDPPRGRHPPFLARAGHRPAPRRARPALLLPVVRGGHGGEPARLDERAPSRAERLPTEPPPLDLPAIPPEVLELPPAASAALAARPAPQRPPAANALELPAGDARGLRVYETFPRLPDALAQVGRRYLVEVEICVNGAGRVDQVHLRQGAAAELDQAVVAALRTWRYRPHTVAGAARPFCHALRIVYSSV